MRRVSLLSALALILAGCTSTTAPQLEAPTMIAAPAATEVRVVPSHDSDPEAPRLVGVKAWLDLEGLHIVATADRDASGLGDSWLADGAIRTHEGERTYYLSWTATDTAALGPGARLYAYEAGGPGGPFPVMEVAVTKRGRHFEFTVPPALFRPNFPPARVLLYVRPLPDWEPSALYEFDVRGGAFD